MEKNIYKWINGNIDVINSKSFNSEKELQDLIEILIKNEKNFLGNKIVAYKREHKTESGRPDFVLMNTEGDLLIMECKIINNSHSRRKVLTQLLDYVANFRFTDINLSNWVILHESAKDILNPDNINKELYIICDEIYASLHNLVNFLKDKDIIINLVTLNLFLLNNNKYLTITPHVTLMERNISMGTVQIFLNSISDLKIRNSFENFINITNYNKSLADIKKQATKRLSIHIKGVNEKFPIWFSQRTVRNIDYDNISFPKEFFCNCSNETYKKIQTDLYDFFKNNLNIIEKDDVWAYLKIEDLSSVDFEKILTDINKNLK